VSYQQIPQYCHQRRIGLQPTFLMIRADNNPINQVTRMDIVRTIVRDPELLLGAAAHFVGDGSLDQGRNSLNL